MFGFRPPMRKTVYYDFVESLTEFFDHHCLTVAVTDPVNNVSGPGAWKRG
jgi:hypothetical protein